MGGGGGGSKYHFVWEWSKRDHVNEKTLDKPLKMFVSFWRKKSNNRPNKFTFFILTFPRWARIQRVYFFFVPSDEANDYFDIICPLQMKQTISVINLYMYLPHIISCTTVNKTHPTNIEHGDRCRYLHLVWSSRDWFT